MGVARVVVAHQIVVHLSDDLARELDLIIRLFEPVLGIAKPALLVRLASKYARAAASKSDRVGWAIARSLSTSDVNHTVAFRQRARAV